MNAKPLIPWIGGKTRLADKLLPLFPEHTCYVEPFAGAAGLLFKKEPSKVEVLNDINGDLVNLYRVVQHHLVEFLKCFEYAVVGRQMFEWEQMKNPETLTDIQRAARFFYLQKLAFGGKVSGQTFGTATTSPPRLNLRRIEEDLTASHLRISRVHVEHLNWQECIQKYDRPHTLFYLDPPYWETEGYGVEFPIEQYEQMAYMATHIKGKLVISVNDHKDMRRVFKGLRTKTVPITYTVGGKQGRKPKKELIIRSW